MVARQTQTPKSTVERVARLAEQHQELRREVGQTPSALTDGDGNSLALSGGNYPALAAAGQDVVAVFEGTTLALRSSGGTADRDLTARNITYSGALATSDGRLKEGFAPVPPGLLDRLLASPVQQWRWKPKSAWREPPDDRVHIHPTAQDLPAELVATTDDGSLAVDPLSVTGALLAVVQRQQRQIDQLAAQVKALGPANPPADPAGGAPVGGKP